MKQEKFYKKKKVIHRSDLTRATNFDT